MIRNFKFSRKTKRMTWNYRPRVPRGTSIKFLHSYVFHYTVPSNKLFKIYGRVNIQHHGDSFTVYDQQTDDVALHLPMPRKKIELLDIVAAMTYIRDQCIPVINFTAKIMEERNGINKTSYHGDTRALQFYFDSTIKFYLTEEREFSMAIEMKHTLPNPNLHPKYLEYEDTPDDFFIERIEYESFEKLIYNYDEIIYAANQIDVANVVNAFAAKHDILLCDDSDEIWYGKECVITDCIHNDLIK